MPSIYQWGPVSDEVLSSWGGKLQESMQRAAEAGQAWKARKEFLREYYYVNKYNAGQARDGYKGDWELQDRLSEWNWHRGEVQRLKDAIEAEYYMRLMMLTVRT